MITKKNLGRLVFDRRQIEEGASGNQRELWFLHT